MARFEEEIKGNSSRGYNQQGSRFGPGPMPGYMQGGDFMPPSYNNLQGHSSRSTTYSAPAIISKPANVIKPEPIVEKVSALQPPMAKIPKMDISAKYSLQVPYI